MEKSLVSSAMALLLLLGQVAVWNSGSAAEKSDSPTILSCTFNAYAQQGYGFEEKEWGRNLESAKNRSSPPFDILVKGAVTLSSDIFTELIFSGLDTEAPRVRELGGTKRNEFNASILTRTEHSLIIVWRNKPGFADWAWLASINRQHRVAIVASVYDGLISINGGLETMDCR